MAHPILQRFEQTKKYDSKGYNCIGAAYFLVGLDSVETKRDDGRILKNEPRIRVVDSLEEAVMIGVVVSYDSDFVCHLAVINPIDRSKILHRWGPNEDTTEDSIDEMFWYDRCTSKLKTILLALNN